MQKKEEKITSAFSTIFFTTLVLIICVASGIYFLVNEFPGEQPSDLIRIIVAISFISSGIGIFIFGLIRTTNKLVISEDGVYISKLMSKIKLDWDNIESIFIKFTGKVNLFKRPSILDLFTTLNKKNFRETGSLVFKFTLRKI